MQSREDLFLSGFASLREILSYVPTRTYPKNPQDSANEIRPGAIREVAISSDSLLLEVNRHGDSIKKHTDYRFPE
jgi:hypothetical protein